MATRGSKSPGLEECPAPNGGDNRGELVTVPGDEVMRRAPRPTRAMNYRYNEVAEIELHEAATLLPEEGGRTGVRVSRRGGLGCRNHPPIANTITQDEGGGVRRCRIRRFPYALFYRMTSLDEVEIVAVAHSAAGGDIARPHIESPVRALRPTPGRTSPARFSLSPASWHLGSASFARRAARGRGKGRHAAALGTLTGRMEPQDVTAGTTTGFVVRRATSPPTRCRSSSFSSSGGHRRSIETRSADRGTSNSASARSTSPDLIRVAQGWRRHWFDKEETPDVWAHIHASRSRLGQLGAVEAIEPLLGLLNDMQEEGDDWSLEEIPVVLAQSGPASIKPIVGYLKSPGPGHILQIRRRGRPGQNGQTVA